MRNIVIIGNAIFCDVKAIAEHVRKIVNLQRLFFTIVTIILVILQKYINVSAFMIVLSLKIYL